MLWLRNGFSFIRFVVTNSNRIIKNYINVINGNFYNIHKFKFSYLENVDGFEWNFYELFYPRRRSVNAALNLCALNESFRLKIQFYPNSNENKWLAGSSHLLLESLAQHQHKLLSYWRTEILRVMSYRVVSLSYMREFVPNYIIILMINTESLPFSRRVSANMKQ